MVLTLSLFTVSQRSCGAVRKTSSGAKRCVTLTTVALCNREQCCATGHDCYVVPIANPPACTRTMKSRQHNNILETFLELKDANFVIVAMAHDKGLSCEDTAMVRRLFQSVGQKAHADDIITWWRLGIQFGPQSQHPIPTCGSQISVFDTKAPRSI